MDGAMGQEEDVVEAVLTCEGDFHDPELSVRIERFRHRLKDLLLTEKQRLQVKKIEPWNSVKVTFTIPRAAAIRLRQLAQNGNDALRQMGVLSVQIQGDSQISLTIAGRNNEPTQLLLRTPPTSQAGNSSLPPSMVGTDTGVQNSEDYGSSQGSSGDDLTRRNIVNYLRQGAGLRQNTIFDTILGPVTSSVPMLGFDLDLPQPLDSVAGPSGSNTVFRPNSIATTSLQNSVLKGPHLNSSFPFAKTPGAFHPPVPRHSSCAGQGPATNSTHHIQSGNSSSGRLLGSLGHDTPSTQQNLSSPSPSAHMFQHNTNTFNPVDTLRLSPAASSANLNALPLHLPPSSPTSSFMIDLPPPPPYPSTSSANRQGKPVTSSSPLLVNLLQTDPLTATVGLASGNPNKPLTAGELNSSSPSKKRRSKKQKDGLTKSYLLNDNATSSRSGVYPWLFAPDVSVDHSSSRVPENTATAIDFMPSRTDIHAASHIPDSFLMKPLPDSKPSFLLDRPGSEGHIGSPSDEFSSDFSSRSAIGAGYSSSNISDSNGQEPFLKDLDPFSLEIAAGKIINPYTGHLEPRDSVVDNVQVRVRDQSSYSQRDNFATQMLARKAKELKSHENSVPNSSSHVLDVHVMKTAISIHNSVSTSTAAALRSGGPLQASNDQLTSSVPTHHQNSVGDGSVRETRDSSLSSSIYALTTKPWQEVGGTSDVGFKVSSSTVFSSSPRKVSSSLSNTIHKNFTPASVPLNGPLGGGQVLKHNPSQHHRHLVSSSSSSAGIRPPQGSVIYSSASVSSSLPFPVSQQSFVAQTQSQSSLAATAATHATPASKLQNSLPSTSVSSSNSLTSRLGSASFSSSQPSHVQVTNRMKLVDTSHFPSNQHSQAASSETVTGSVTPSTNQILLNSLPDKHTDSQNGTSSPPDNKTSSEGDENSNHSVLITDTLPEHSGTAVLLEHSGVKAENHDSGIGSSSERSDDTPSEPGDNEFRSGQSGAEGDDSGKASLQKPINCKLESKVNSSSNTITVGYMVNPSDSAAQSKLTQIMDVSKNSVVISTSSSASDISHFFHTHVMSLDKQAGILAAGTQASSVRMGVEDSKGQSNPSLPGRVRENGQSPEDVGNISSVKINGPSSQSSIEKMIKAVSDKQHKKVRASPKQNSKKGLMDVPTEHQKPQAEVLEKMSKLHQYAESTKETSNVSVKTNNSEKADSPDALSQRLNSSEDRPDQIIFDMEELVNGRSTGLGSSGVESRGGSNITSIYSKRSSPVNVNMLNHIYAPGLPLPRRLTESVQRLVKPLPAAETSVSYSQMRPCKSPGSGGSPRAGSSASFQCSLRMSGVRSPGASMPKLIPSDKHSLISGGLDLAGLSNLQCASTATSDHTELVSYKKGSQPLTTDVLLQDTHCFSSSQNSPPNLLLDSKPYSSKMLSQSFPPHKSKDLKPNSSHANHSLLLSLQSNSSFNEKNLSSSVHNTRHTQLPKARAECSPSSSQDSRLHLSNRSHQDILQSGHPSSVSDTSQARLGSQQLSAADLTHSTLNSHVVEHSSAYTSHSNAASPVMPILQLGQDLPVTPTLASIMPSLSSQSLSSISSPKEISAVSIGSSVSLCGTTLSTQNKHVPYSNTLGSSGTTSNATAKSTPVSTFVSTLSPVSTAPLAVGKTEDSPNYTSAPPRLLSTLEMSNLKPKKVNISNNPSPSSRSGSSTPLFSRNLFESVSGTLTHDSISLSKLELSSDSNSLDSAGHGTHQLSVYGTESPSDSFSSLSASQESKGDQLTKSLRQKSTDGGDKRVAAGLSQSPKADLLKVIAASKPVQTSQEAPVSTFLSTEVVNLDFSLPTQACDVLSLNIGSSKSTAGSVLKTSVSESLQESAHIKTSQPSSTSSLSSVAIHISSGMSRTSDNLADTKISATAGKEDAISKMTPGLSNSNSSMPLVKEPILEVLASALGSSVRKTSTFSPGKSFVEKQVPSCESGFEFHRVEEDTATENKIVTIQSGPRRPRDFSHRRASLDLSSSDSSSALSSDPFTKRFAKKRKFPHGDDVMDDASSADSTPVKQLHFIHILESGTKSNAKSVSADGDLTKILSNITTDSAESKDSHGGKCHNQPKSPTILMTDPPDFEIEKNNRVTLEATQEETDSQNRSGKTCRLSASENKEHCSTKESRPHRSVVSNTSSSDENQSKKASDEIKDSAFKESRLHCRVVESGSEGKDRRLHRTGATSLAIEDKDMTRDGHSTRASSTDQRENSQKDTILKDSSKFHREAAEVPDDKDDHQDNSSQLNLSADDLAGSGQEVSLETPGGSDGGLADSKLEDGQKKSHRIRRQFYAYVPERSIDQRYFDTTILSGRTRSKNKPSDLVGQDATSSQDEAVPATNAVETHSQHPAGVQQSPVGKADGSSAEKAGGKRPTRAARTKDSPQDQNASKRRRVQQHR